MSETGPRSVRLESVRWLLRLGVQDEADLLAATYWRYDALHQSAAGVVIYICHGDRCVD